MERVRKVGERETETETETENKWQRTRKEERRGEDSVQKRVVYKEVCKLARRQRLGASGSGGIVANRPGRGKGGQAKGSRVNDVSGIL